MLPRSHLRDAEREAQKASGEVTCPRGQPVSRTRTQAAHPGAEPSSTHLMAAPITLILSLLFHHPVSWPFWLRPLSPLCCWSSAQVPGSGAKHWLHTVGFSTGMWGNTCIDRKWHFYPKRAGFWPVYSPLLRLKNQAGKVLERARKPSL